MSRQEKLILMWIALGIVFILGVFVGFWLCDYLSMPYAINPNIRRNIIVY